MQRGEFCDYERKVVEVREAEEPRAHPQEGLMNRLSRASITSLLAVLFLLAAIVVVSRSATVKASLQQTGSDGARRITPDEVRELLKKNQAVLIDVRGESAYKAGHIKGALWIPANEIGDRAKDLPRDKTIVTYCS